MNAPRILEFLTYSGIGGTQQVFLEFMRRASHHRYSYTVGTLLWHDWLNDELTRMQIPNFTLNMKGYYDARAWWNLTRFLRTHSIDLIRTYGLQAHLFGRICGAFAGVPVHITSIRSTDPWRKWHHSTLDRMTSGLTDLYLSNSEAGTRMTRQREGIVPRKTMTIHNGIDVEFVRSKAIDRPEIAAQYRRELGIDLSAPLIGIIATFRKMKGHAVLIDALPDVLRAHPSVKCLFIGGAFVAEPEYEGELRQHVRSRQLEHAIIFTGFRRDIPELLSLLDVVVLPSSWEGLPSSILEAMALRKPVIASAVGGIPEIVVHEQTGLLISPQNPRQLADALLRLLSSPDMAVRMGQTGYERVKAAFSLDAMVAKTEAIYAELLCQKGRYA